MRWHLFLPLLSSWLYVGGALFLRRSADLGVGVWRAAFVANLLTSALFAPLLVLGGNPQPWTLLWQPAVGGFLLVLGQALAFLAFTRGDVSVAMPVLGAKTVIVAFFSTTLAVQTVPPKLWLGAVLSAAAIALLHGGGGGSGSRHHDVGLSIGASLAAAASFALFDVLTQKWSPVWGAGLFLPLVNGFAAAYSFALIPAFEAPLRAVPGRVWPWLGGGAALIALQSLVLITTVAVFGDATAVNVVFSSRGLWAVVVVWSLGHLFQSREQKLGGRVLGWRLAGAGLMTGAIVLVLV